MSRMVWILHTATGGTRGGAVEVCSYELYARKGAPHHGFMQECVRWELSDDGTLSNPVSVWFTDEHGNAPGEGSWALKIGEQQVRFLTGCLEFGGWYKNCGWKLHRNIRHDERLAARLVQRGLLVTQERVNARGERFTLHTVADPELAREIVDAGGVVPAKALKEGRILR